MSKYLLQCCTVYIYQKGGGASLFILFLDKSSSKNAILNKLGICRHPVAIDGPLQSWSGSRTSTIIVFILIINKACTVALPECSLDLAVFLVQGYLHIVQVVLALLLLLRHLILLLLGITNYMHKTNNQTHGLPASKCSVFLIRICFMRILYT